MQHVYHVLMSSRLPFKQMEGVNEGMNFHLMCLLSAWWQFQSSNRAGFVKVHPFKAMDLSVICSVGWPTCHRIRQASLDSNLLTQKSQWVAVFLFLLNWQRKLNRARNLEIPITVLPPPSTM